MKTIKKRQVLKFFSLVLLMSSLSCKEREEQPESTHLNSKLAYGEVRDIDGNRYATIQIGTQNWMAENLKTSRYANGDNIPNVKETSKWVGLTSGAWSHYNNETGMDELHGKLYNWYAASDPRNLCPEGWHVPSDGEWIHLVNFLGGKDLAGAKMKSTLDGFWYDGIGAADNGSGFSALPSGQRSRDGFILMSYRADFWSSTSYSSTEAYQQEIFWNGDGIGRYNDYNYRGFSIRCVED